MAQIVDFEHVFKSTEEVVVPEAGKVLGNLPKWLNGTYLRVGPGKYDFDQDFTLNHVFDGYSVITKFKISGPNSTVSLEKKYLDSEAYKKAKRAQKPIICEFGTRGYSDPAKNLISRLIPSLIPDLTDNCNMALYRLGNQIIAGAETCHFIAIDPNQLNSTSKFDSSKLFGTNTFTCHPLRDPDTGITYNIGASILTGLKYNVIQIPPPQTDENSNICPGAGSAKELLKKSKILCSFPSSWNGCFSFSHSFGISKNYIIFIEQPYVLLATRILAAVVTKGHCIQNWLEWRPELKNNFWLIEKTTGKVLKVNYQSEQPFFFLHIINCYEDSGHLIIDLMSFPNPTALESMTIANLRNGTAADTDQPVGQRFVLPIIRNYDELQDDGSNLISTIKTQATAVLKKDRNGQMIVLSPENLTEDGLELPKINPNYIGRKYKYFYASGLTMVNGHFKNAICKVNLGKKLTTLWQDTAAGSGSSSDSDAYQFFGEPLFVPRRSSQRPSCIMPVPNQFDDDEDDGVILCPATTTSGIGQVKQCKDYLLCLDARTFKELARVNFESHIPQGLHGIFLPS